MVDHDKNSVRGGGPTAAESLPDLGFTLGGSPAVAPIVSVGAVEAPVRSDRLEPESDGSEGGPPSGPEPTQEEQARDLVVRVAQALAALAPPGWRELSAIFALTTVIGGGRIYFGDDEGRVMEVAMPDEVLELADAQRRASAGSGDGPWWRMLVQLDTQGQLEVDYDYGDEPFPSEQMFAPEAYLADLEEFPRSRLPVWLAAYLHHGGRQLRSPAQAAERSRADREAGVFATPSRDDLPDLPTLWVRWTVLASAFVALGSEWGPRIAPSTGLFVGAGNSGATLCLLPRGRAVLSGGVWNAPALVAAYQDGTPLPDLYAGAPDWVTDQVLDARVGSGLLSFCYWWLGDRWYRGESPGGEELGEAVPGVWSDETVEQLLRTLIDAGPGDLRADHVSDLLAAAYEGTVTRAHLLATFGADADIDTAMNQLTLAGAAIVSPQPMREDDR